MTFHKHKPVTVSTLAGKEGDAGFSGPYGITIDAAGNLYVADTDGGSIRKVTPEGEFSTIAGNDTQGFADGLGGVAQFHWPHDIAIDAAGNLYVADTDNHRIRKITPKGVVSTLAGSGVEGFADGTGSAAQFHYPEGITIDRTGNLFVADSLNYCIRKVTPKGVVSTFVGGDSEGGADGQGSAAQFGWLHGIAIDAAGNLYVSDTWMAKRWNHRIRKVTPLGEVSTFVGGLEGEVDGIGSAAQFDQPSGIAIDAAGNLYVADRGNHCIRKVTPKGEVSTFAGKGSYGFADGTGSAAQFHEPYGITIDATGNLYVADSGNYCIRKITPAGEVSTLAGKCNCGFADGTGNAAQFGTPSRIAIDATSNLYVADTNNHRIRKVTPAGEVSTLAGNGRCGFADGTGSAAQFSHPEGITIDAAGNLYVADRVNDCIRKITPAGEVSTIAGNGTRGFADGRGSDAQFLWPHDIVADAAGNLYVADTNNNRIRKITPKGDVSTLAGSEGGFADGTGSAAQFHSPQGIAIDATGNLYVADSCNNRIRKITPRGEVSTLAGSEEGFADGTGSAAQFSYPNGISTDAAGNLYVADSSNNRIRMVTPAGEVCTLAGSMKGFVDGPGDGAQFHMPSGVAIDAAGNLYVADSFNNRIRKIEPLKMMFPFSILYSLLSRLLGFLERRTQKLEKALAEYEDEDENVDVDDDDIDDQESAVWFHSPHGIAVDAAGNLYVADTFNNRICKITPTGETSVLAGGTEGFADGQGSDAQFDFPSGIAIDTAGNLYVTDEDNHRIRKITPNGKVSTLAGSSGSTGFDSEGGFADGQGSAAQFSHPSDIAIDATGNLYVADSMNHCIRKVTPMGEVSTFAGRGATGREEGGFADGNDARFNFPRAIAIGATGDLYVADAWNFSIRRITPNGEVSTLAGNGTAGDADGTGSAAQFGSPSSIAIDAAGNLYVAEARDNRRIRKVTPAGEVSTFAGSGTDGDADGTGSAAQFGSPSGITIDATGNLFVTDENRIRKVTPSGKVSTLFDGFTGGFADNTGDAALFGKPLDIVMDATGDLYVADTENHRILKITPKGEVSIFAGSGTAGNVDGPASIARFKNPSGIVMDAAGNLFVADEGNYCIRKISPNGEVGTLAGSTEGFADGRGSAAQFHKPHGIAIDAAGNLYVTEETYRCIRKVTPTGEVSTFVGNDEQDDDADENAVRFCSPGAIVADAAGNLYVADRLNYRICKVTPAGGVSVLAGSGKDGYADGIGSVARFGFSGPHGIAVDAEGNLYVADEYNNSIRKVAPTGEVSTLAGGSESGNVDGRGSAAQFDKPTGITIDAAGNLYVADSWNDSIRKVTLKGKVSTFVSGTKTTDAFGYADGQGSAARFNSPVGITIDAAGNLYVADSDNERIRKITPQGEVSTLAGSGESNIVDGQGSAAQFSYPCGIAMDAAGNLYVADTRNHRIRRITPTGDVSTFAGGGRTGLKGGGFVDGQGSAARFNWPDDVAVDAAGNLYVADRDNNCIRKVTPTGEVSTFAGSGEQGDADGRGRAAQFDDPRSIVMDAAGNLYVADAGNDRIRKISPKGEVSTFVGSTEGCVDGQGSAAKFCIPSGIAIDAAGNLYVADSWNHRIRKVTPTGEVSTLAGSSKTCGFGVKGGFVDGIGCVAQFNAPFGVAVDAAGNLYVADCNNHRIRKVTPQGEVSTFAGKAVP